MESMLYQGYRFLGGIKHFWMAVRVWKMNLVLEDLARQKRMKMWLKWGLSWGLINVWQSEWSVLSWGPWTTQKKGSSCPARDCGHLDAASWQRSLSHCHLHEQIFDLKRVFQWFRNPHTHLIWVCVTFSFSRNSNSTSKFFILELWTTSERSWQSSWGYFHTKTSSTATRSRSNVSGGVWLPKWKTLKGIMLICSSVVNKKFYSTSLITF